MPSTNPPPAEAAEPPESVLRLVDDDLAIADFYHRELMAPHHPIRNDFRDLVQGYLGAMVSADTMHQLIFGKPLDADEWRKSRV